MTSQHDLASQALFDLGLIEEAQFLDHRIRFGPTQTGWVSFIARQGQRPTILLAPDRDTLMAEAIVTHAPGSTPAMGCLSRPVPQTDSDAPDSC